MKHCVFMVLLLACAARATAGYEISICDSINSKGDCVTKQEVFHYTGDKMKLLAVVHSKDMLRTSKLLFKLYLMKNDREGEIAAEVSTYTKPDWFSAVKRLYFFQPGYYRLDVYTADKSKIGSLFFTLSDRD